MLSVRNFENRPSGCILTLEYDDLQDQVVTEEKIFSTRDAARVYFAHQCWHYSILTICKIMTVYKDFEIETPGWMDTTVLLNLPDLVKEVNDKLPEFKKNLPKCTDQVTEYVNKKIINLQYAINELKALCKHLKL